MPDKEKLGVLLLNLGGPDSLAAVRPFLFNLFRDPDIFDIMSVPLLRWVQTPAAWLISTFRNKKTREYYQMMGGRSPILPLTEDQAGALQQRLTDHGVEIRVYIAMRYWHPFTDEALDHMVADGITRLIVLPLYPQYSLTTTGSSMNVLQECLEKRQLNLPYTLIGHYYDDPGYLSALAARVEEGLNQNDWSCPREEVLIVFSAHSLPQAFVQKTGDIYPQQTCDTAKLLMERHFPNHSWDLCYQSKIGRIPWLQPYTEDKIHELAQQGRDNILLVPLSFVSDHIETLYEIDLLYLPQARSLGMKHAFRAPSLNSHPLFIEALSQLVLRQLHHARELTTV